MRNQFCEKLNSFSSNSDFCFLTGDLGFNALEPLAKNMKKRFINVGVSEQNMLSISAAFARQNIECWAYSIAPFCYARAFEQIRNDISFHNLPVRIVGNGGGYGYGVMGPTHHSIEDYGTLCTLPNFCAFIPTFDEDVSPIIDRLRQHQGPTYLRLGVDEKPKDWIVPKYKKWRQITQGNGPTIISIGPITTTYLEKFNALEDLRPNMWVVSELPILDNLPKKLITQIKQSNKLIIIEEHVANGGIAQQISLLLIQKYNLAPKFVHSYATSHVFSKYGSQNYLRKLSKLDPENLIKIIRNLYK